jgi:glycosyltransferase involved in cell wall biosynthesis
MKLLIVLPSLEFGGIERTTINLLKNTEKGQVAVALHKRIEHYFHNLNCTIYRFEDFGASNPTLSLHSIYSYSKAIKKISNIENPDIVFGIMQFAPVYACCAKDIFFMKPKVVISYRGAVSVFLTQIPSFGRWAKFIVHYSIRRASNIIVPSEGVKRDLTEYFGAPESKIQVIYNGIDLEWVRGLSRDEIDIKKDFPWIITSARLDTAQKDFLTLLKAFSIVRESQRAKLLIIGDGSQKHRVSAWIKEMSLSEDVCLLGFQENPFRYISRADVFVLSSFFEGFGNVIVEAMALGIPVISTDCPSGPSEIIDHGINGFLVPEGDHKRIAEYVLDILHDSELRDRISQAGLRRAENFSARNMAQSYEKHFLEIIGSR